MVREFAISLAILLLVTILVYGGLNLVELSMAGLLARECRHEAFSIRMDPQGALLVAFAGRAARFHAGEFYAALKQWWDRLLDRSEAILHG